MPSRSCKIRSIQLLGAMAVDTIVRPGAVRGVDEDDSAIERALRDARATDARYDINETALRDVGFIVGACDRARGGEPCTTRLI